MASLRWSQVQIAVDLGESPAKVRKWSAGLEPVPPAVAYWIEALARDAVASRDRNPPPRVTRPHIRPNALKAEDQLHYE